MEDLKIKLLNLFCASVNDVLKEADAAIADDGNGECMLTVQVKTDTGTRYFEVTIKETN